MYVQLTMCQFHNCKYGYRDVYELAEVVYNYSRRYVKRSELDTYTFAAKTKQQYPA